MVVCYTKIRTEDRSFYQAMEKYEIYNGRVPFEQFKDIVLGRYGSWDGAPLITECALFQNIVEDMILFRDMTDEDIIDFYRGIKTAVGDKQIHIAYLKAQPDDIRRNLETARQIELMICENCFPAGTRCCPRNRTGKMKLISYEKWDVYCQSRCRYSDRHI